jgi:ketosteroid isomerase-like protein
MNEQDFEEVANLMDDDVIIVRPTGNPLKKKEWLNMLNSSDLVMNSTKMLAVNNVNVCESEKMGYVCYTTHASFTYKGVENSDVAVFVVVFKMIDDKWKITYMQRSTGRDPSEGLPKFN